MCKMMEILVPKLKYSGIIVRNGQGHIFLAHNCRIQPDGTLIPNQPLKSLDPFREKIIEAGKISTEPNPPQFQCDFFGDRDMLRERILHLNKLFGLPGFMTETSLAA